MPISLFAEAAADWEPISPRPHFGVARLLSFSVTPSSRFANCSSVTHDSLTFVVAGYLEHRINLLIVEILTPAAVLLSNSPLDTCYYCF